VTSVTSVVEVELRSGTRLRFEGEAAQLATHSLVRRKRLPKAVFTGRVT